jgi:Ran GTPase-activating protein (RanGAP) involved in mRNA processing and transport
MVQANQDLEMIHLQLSEISICSEIVSLLAKAAEGHKALKTLSLEYTCERSEGKFPPEAIGTMLRNAPALRELILQKCLLGATGAHHLVSGLNSERSGIETLHLSYCELGVMEARILAGLLERNRILKSLLLSNNYIGDDGASALSVALRQNQTLKVLSLRDNEIGGIGASSIADALSTNNTLCVLDLSADPVGDDGATSIANMLKINETVEGVCIAGFGKKG